MTPDLEPAAVDPHSRETASAVTPVSTQVPMRAPTRSATGPVAWARDLTFGVRLAASGHEGTVRAVLTAVGVALGVAVLLFGASVPSMVAGHDSRAAARSYSLTSVPVAANTELVSNSGDTTYYGLGVYGVLMKADGDKPPLPPGVSAFPAPGDMAVSPALAVLLASPRGVLLKQRLDFRIAGVIGEAGLLGPGELAYYAGSARLSPDENPVRIDEFGQALPASPSIRR